MQIQSITSQPNFKGKVIFEPGVSSGLTTYIPSTIAPKLKDISKMVSNKPYDIFISKNKQKPDFYDIAANKTFAEAQKIKEYTVKVKSNSITDSIVEAASDAMEMYEKYIAKGIKE